MNRYFVPLVVVALVSGLAVGLIGGVVARSPETHANVRPEGYDRTPISHVNEEMAFDGLGLAVPQIIVGADQATRGQALFLAYGCAGCHGLAAQGGVVGPALDPGDLTLSQLRREVRSGPKGMPAFREDRPSNDELADIYDFLKKVR